MTNILEINNLNLTFNSPRFFHALKNLRLNVPSQSFCGLVGESGSGKSLTCLAAMGLLNEPNQELTGSIRFAGQELLELTRSKMDQLRGRRIGMIFQNPMSCLNPLMTIGEQISEVLCKHLNLTEVQAYSRSAELLDLAWIPNPKKRLEDYPHQLSGGMRQRVMICMAIACEPELLIADEPTTALDVTIQAQVLDLLWQLKEQQKLTILLVTHDFGLVARYCDSVHVMKQGQVVESTDVEQLFKHPQHAYTQSLLKALPSNNF